jgi:hypothetical protein
MVSISVTVNFERSRKKAYGAVTRTDWCVGKGEKEEADDEQDDINADVEGVCVGVLLLYQHESRRDLN